MYSLSSMSLKKKTSDRPGYHPSDLITDPFKDYNLEAIVMVTVAPPKLPFIRDGQLIVDFFLKRGDKAHLVRIELFCFFFSECTAER